MILVCGATGLLGGEILRRLTERGEAVRALVRFDRDVDRVAATGAEIARGDLRDPASLRDAVAGTETVITTVTAIGRLLAGVEKTTIEKTDGRGTANLIDAAEAAGVKRFVYVSYAGIGHDHTYPLGRAKWANEQRLNRSPMRTVIVKPEAFQDVWFGPLVEVKPDEGKMTIFGRGENPHPYVAVADVAEAIVRLALADDPPHVIEFGGPERLTRKDVARLVEEASGKPMKLRHVPRLALRVGGKALAPFKQELASVMAMGLDADTRPHATSDAALRELGIEPRPSTTYIRETYGGV